MREFAVTPEQEAVLFGRDPGFLYLTKAYLGETALQFQLTRMSRPGNPVQYLRKLGQAEPGAEAITNALINESEALAEDIDIHPVLHDTVSRVGPILPNPDRDQPEEPYIFLLPEVLTTLVSLPTVRQEFGADLSRLAIGIESRSSEAIVCA